MLQITFWPQDVAVKRVLKYNLLYSLEFLQHYQGTDKIEIEANAFAAELLMPENVLRDITRHQPLDAFDDRAVQSLAVKFGVSVRALTIRLTKLGLGSL